MFADLLVKIFEFLSFGVRWDFDRALLRDERDLVVSVFVGRAVKYGTDPFADRHVVNAPARIEQNVRSPSFAVQFEK